MSTPLRSCRLRQPLQCIGQLGRKGFEGTMQCTVACDNNIVLPRSGILSTNKTYSFFKSSTHAVADHSITLTFRDGIAETGAAVTVLRIGTVFIRDPARFALNEE